MRSQNVLLFALAVLSSHVVPSVGAPQDLLARRDSEASATAGGTSTIANTVTSGDAPSTGNPSQGSATPTASVTQSTDEALSTADGTPSNSLSSVVSATPAPTSAATSTTDGTTTESAPASNGDGLPLAPKITPALGFAGGILMLSGVFYALMGIRRRRVHTFLSTAYLTSLSITVLIVYVMNPPVTNAVQGAFFVAALLTGLIFGGLSLIFTEIAEGLGCLLGGFCLSMWFLVLRPSGLIQSDIGRPIFVAVLSILAWALSFRSYTREYGLIACISFAGATIMMLGVDCFSRAGLKEFWLYIWDLNSNIFPLNTSKYPVTRGIRVEIAGIIIIFLLGLVSQMRVWKLIREHRAKKDAEKQQELEDREKLELEIGKRIEQDVDRERATWEATFDDKKSAKPVVRELSGSSSVDEPIELDATGAESTSNIASRRTSDQNPLSSKGAKESEDDEIQQIDAQGNPVDEQQSLLEQSDLSTPKKNSVENPHGPKKLGRRLSVSPSESLRSSGPAPPPALPLPLPRLVHGDSAGSADNTSSSPAVSTSGQRMGSQNHHVALPPKRLSVGQHSQVAESQAALVVADAASDGSSVAATFDGTEEDTASLPELSRHSSVADDSEETPISSRQSSRGVSPSRPASGLGRTENGSVPASILSATNQPLPTPDDEEAVELAQTDDIATQQNPKTPSSSKGRSRFSMKSHKSSHTESSQVESLSGSLMNHLPQNLPKIAMCYRTNEWAKHLEAAERPEIEDIPEPESPGVKIDIGFQEAVRSARAERDSETLPAVYPGSSPPSSESSRSMSEQQKALQRMESARSNISLDVPSPITPSRSPPSLQPYGSAGRSEKRASLSRAPSKSSDLNGSAPPPRNPRAHRLSSSPLVPQTLMEEEDPQGGVRLEALTPPLGANSLMSKRSSMLKSRVSTMSFMSPPKFSLTAPSDVASGHHSSPNESESDDVPLSQRKRLIQQGEVAIPGRESRKARHSLPHAHSFDFQQPQRSPSVIDQNRRESMLATWRASVRKSIEAERPLEQNENRRALMINERRQQKMQQQHQAMAATIRDNAFDSMMRRGDMLDLHRDAMRRMQAKANRNADTP